MTTLLFILVVVSVLVVGGVMWSAMLDELDNIQHGDDGEW